MVKKNIINLTGNFNQVSKKPKTSLDNFRNNIINLTNNLNSVSKKTKTSLDNLPNEILMNIFKSVDPKDRSQLASVSKRHKKIVNNIPGLEIIHYTAHSNRKSDEAIDDITKILKIN